MEDSDLVLQETGYPQSLTYPRPAECGSRKAIQSRPDHPDWSLLSGGFPVNVQQVALTSDLFATRFNKLPLFVSPVPDPLAWAVDAQPTMGGSRHICLPTGSHLGQSGSHLGQSGGKAAGLPMQENHSDCTRVALHALVLGSSDHVKLDPSVPAQSQPFNLLLIGIYPT